MRWFVWVAGILFMLMGIRSILYPQKLKVNLQKFLSQEKHYLFALIPIFIGLLLIIGAFKTTAKGFALILGVLICAKGVLFFVKPNLMQKMCNWWLKRSERTYQIWGIVIYTLGLLLLLWC